MLQDTSQGWDTQGISTSAWKNNANSTKLKNKTTSWLNTKWHWQVHLSAIRQEAITIKIGFAFCLLESHTHSWSLVNSATSFSLSASTDGDLSCSAEHLAFRTTVGSGLDSEMFLKRVWRSLGRQAEGKAVLGLCVMNMATWCFSGTWESWNENVLHCDNANGKQDRVQPVSDGIYHKYTAFLGATTNSVSRVKGHVIGQNWWNGTVSDSTGSHN